MHILIFILAWTTPDGSFTLSWIINNTVIRFNATASTTGWIGLGLNTGPSMTGADMYTGWVNDTNGKVTLLDTYATGQLIPTVDPMNNILNYTGSQVMHLVIMNY